MHLYGNSLKSIYEPDSKDKTKLHELLKKSQFIVKN